MPESKGPSPSPMNVLWGALIWLPGWTSFVLAAHHDHHNGKMFWGSVVYLFTAGSWAFAYLMGWHDARNGSSSPDGAA